MDYPYKCSSQTEWLSYSRFINGLRLAGIQIDRKILQICVNDQSGFAQLVNIARDRLGLIINYMDIRKTSCEVFDFYADIKPCFGGSSFAKLMKNRIELMPTQVWFWALYP